MQDLEVRGHEVPVGDVEGHGLLRARLATQGLEHRGVRVLEGAHPVGRVQVERDPVAVLVRPREEAPRVREQLPVPGVARPARAVPALHVLVREVPVHVHHQHGERQAAPVELGDQLPVLGLVVGVVPAPPVAERPARQDGLRPGQGVEVAQRLPVVVAPAEEVEVHGALLGRARRVPAVVREQHRGGVVDHPEALAGRDARLERDRAVGLVQGARGPAQGGGGDAVAPHAVVAGHAAADLRGQSRRAEGPLVVAEVDPLRAQLQPGRRAPHPEVRHREPAVDGERGRTVLEAAGGTVLQAQQPGAQHADAVVLAGDDGARVRGAGAGGTEVGEGHASTLGGPGRE